MADLSAPRPVQRPEPLPQRDAGAEKAREPSGQQRCLERGPRGTAVGEGGQGEEPLRRDAAEEEIGRRENRIHGPALGPEQRNEPAAGHQGHPGSGCPQGSSRATERERAEQHRHQQSRAARPVRRTARRPGDPRRRSARHSLVRLELEARGGVLLEEVAGAKCDGLPGRQRPFHIGRAIAVQRAREEPAAGGRRNAMLLIEEDRPATVDHPEITTAGHPRARRREPKGRSGRHARPGSQRRSEEHPSELQSRGHLVCRLLLEKKKARKPITPTGTLTKKNHSQLSASVRISPSSTPAAAPNPTTAPFFFLMMLRPPRSTLFPYTTLFR